MKCHILISSHSAEMRLRNKKFWKHYLLSLVSLISQHFRTSFLLASFPKYILSFEFNHVSKIWLKYFRFCKHHCAFRKLRNALLGFRSTFLDNNFWWQLNLIVWNKLENFKTSKCLLRKINSYWWRISFLMFQ